MGFCTPTVVKTSCSLFTNLRALLAFRRKSRGDIGIQEART
jgi:hypothetical protein